jgi:hypothetical protein
MKWQHPPIIKIYEALGAIADGRVEINGMTAKVYSSTRITWKQNFTAGGILKK